MFFFCFFFLRNKDFKIFWHNGAFCARKIYWKKFITECLWWPLHKKFLKYIIDLSWKDLLLKINNNIHLHQYWYMKYVIRDSARYSNVKTYVADRRIYLRVEQWNISEEYFRHGKHKNHWWLFGIWGARGITGAVGSTSINAMES